MSADDASSDEWFARYLLDTAFVVVLVLAAIGVSLYLDGGAYLRDWSQEPGVGFLVCMVLCPVLVIVTLGLVIYAGIRLFLRPRTFGHTLIRFTLLVAHVFIFLVCIDTISSSTTALVTSFGEFQTETGITGAGGIRDYSGSQYDVREGSPDDSAAPPRSFPGAPGAGTPGRGMGSR